MYAHTNICTHYIFACTHMFTYTHITTLFSTYHAFVWASQVAQLVKNPPANQEAPSFDSWVGKFPWRRDRLPTPGFLGFPGGSAGKGKWSCSVMSDSLWPQGLQPTRLLHPWDFPGKSTGVGCHCLLQGIFLIQGLNPGLPHCRQMNPGKETTYNVGDLGSIPEFGRSSGEGNSYPLQCSGLKNSMDRGAWQATVHGLQRARHNWGTFMFIYMLLFPQL